MGADFRSTSRDVAVTLLLAVTYAATAYGGLALATENPSVSAVWPATGLAIGALVRTSLSRWPGILAGAFAANLATSGAPLVSLAIALGNTGEAVLGAAAVQRCCGGARAFEQVATFLRFVLLAGFLAPVVSATVGTCALAAGGLTTWAELPGLWLTWWLGDAGGAVLLGPAVILLAPGRIAWTRARVAEALALTLGLALTLFFTFGDWGQNPYTAWPRALHCLPIVAWCAFRFTPRETSLVVLACVVAGLWSTATAHGPFAVLQVEVSMQMAQMFTGVVGVTAMAMAAGVEAHRHTETKLEAANQALEAYACSVSHDLRAPARNVDNFAELVLVEHGERLDADARQCLGRIRENARRMRDIIEGLLDLARVDRAELRREAVDLAPLTRELLDELRAASPEREVQVELPESMPAFGDPRLLRQLLANLVSNAWKFTARTPGAHIELGGCPTNGGYAYWVRDNGVGFDDRMSDRLFVPFSRLHSGRDFAGSGIGLATVSRIVERHGGRISATGAVGRGATFTFALPKGSPADAPAHRAARAPAPRRPRRSSGPWAG